MSEAPASGQARGQPLQQPPQASFFSGVTNNSFFSPGASDATPAGASFSFRGMLPSGSRQPQATTTTTTTGGGSGLTQFMEGLPAPPPDMHFEQSTNSLFKLLQEADPNLSVPSLSQIEVLSLEAPSLHAFENAQAPPESNSIVTALNLGTTVRPGGNAPPGTNGNGNPTHSPSSRGNMDSASASRGPFSFLSQVRKSGDSSNSNSQGSAFASVFQTKAQKAQQRSGPGKGSIPDSSRGSSSSATHTPSKGARGGKHAKGRRTTSATQRRQQGKRGTNGQSTDGTRSTASSKSEAGPARKPKRGARRAKRTASEPGDPPAPFGQGQHAQQQQQQQATGPGTEGVGADLLTHMQMANQLPGGLSGAMAPEHLQHLQQSHHQQQPFAYPGQGPNQAALFQLQQFQQLQQLQQLQAAQQQHQHQQQQPATHPSQLQVAQQLDPAQLLNTPGQAAASLLIQNQQQQPQLHSIPGSDAPQKTWANSITSGPSSKAGSTSSQTARSPGQNRAKRRTSSTSGDKMPGTEPKKPRSRQYRRQPNREDFDTDEAFSEAWAEWRAIRERNNAAVHRSREKAKARKAMDRQAVEEREREFQRLKTSVDMLTKNVQLLIKARRSPEQLTSLEEAWLQTLCHSETGMALASQCALFA